MLITRPDQDPRAPVLLCDVDACEWAWPIPAGEGTGGWTQNLNDATEQLKAHVAEAHPAAPVDPGWEVAITWGTAPPLPPERGHGEEWEPFSAWQESRGGLPGWAPAWRRQAYGVRTGA